MTLRSASSEGRGQDALSGRPKVAIVTGGSSGIGLEMVKRLIEKGYRVVANSRGVRTQHDSGRMVGNPEVIVSGHLDEKSAIR